MIGCGKAGVGFVVGFGKGYARDVEFRLVVVVYQFAKFRLDNYAVVVSVLDDFGGNLDVFLKGMVACVNHYGSEAVVDSGFAKVVAIAVVEVQANGKTRIFNCGFD